MRSDSEEGPSKVQGGGRARGGGPDEGDKTTIHPTDALRSVEDEHPENGDYHQQSMNVQQDEASNVSDDGAEDDHLQGERPSETFEGSLADYLRMVLSEEEEEYHLREDDLLRSELEAAVVAVEEEDADTDTTTTINTGGQLKRKATIGTTKSTATAYQWGIILAMLGGLVTGARLRETLQRLQDCVAGPVVKSPWRANVNNNRKARSILVAGKGEGEDDIRRPKESMTLTWEKRGESFEDAEERTMGRD